MTRILFVEDNANTARAVKVMLELRGYTVDTATSIAQAKDSLTANTYDVLVSDIRLPDGSGYELLSLLRNPHRSIALSGFTSEADRKDALAKGFAAVVGKPFKTEELLASIESIGKQ